MTRRTELVKQVRRLARTHGTRAVPIRQGSHEIWECAGLTFPIPRHREIAEGTARAILRRLAEHLEALDEQEEER